MNDSAVYLSKSCISSKPVLQRAFSMRTCISAVLVLLATFFVFEEFWFRVTWTGPPDHGTVAGVMYVVAAATWYGPLSANGLRTPAVRYVICLSWFITCIITGLIVVNVDYNAVGNHLPAIWLHVINLVLVLLLTRDSDAWLLVSPILGLLIQVPWYRSYKLDPSSIECSGGASAFDCRHRVEYYVACGVMFVIYVMSFIAAIQQHTAVNQFYSW